MKPQLQSRLLLRSKARIMLLAAISAAVELGCDPAQLEAWNRNIVTETTSQALVPTLDVASACETLPPATATFLYVGSSGNNSTAIANDRTRPWATINGAFGQVPTTLNNTYVVEVIDSSTYNETLNISGRTTSSNNTLIFRTAVGAAPVINNGGTATPITLSTNNTSIVGLTITGFTSFDGIVLGAATTANNLLCNSIKGNRRGIFASAGTQTSLTIEGNRIEFNNQGGISLATGTGSLILHRDRVRNKGKANAS